MKVNTYRLLDQCIESGLQLGWNRAHKHTDVPEQETINEQQKMAILEELNGWFFFDREEFYG